MQAVIQHKLFVSNGLMKMLRCLLLISSPNLAFSFDRETYKNISVFLEINWQIIPLGFQSDQ